MVNPPVRHRAWTDLPAPAAAVAATHRRWPGIVARLVILWGLAAVVAAGEDLRRALAVRVLAVALLVAAVASRRAARLLDLPFVWTARALRWAAWLAAAVVLEVVFALPARTVGALTRRDPMSWRRRAAPSSWEPQAPVDRRRGTDRATDAGAALAGSSSGRGPLRLVLRPLALLLVLLLGVDAIAGAAFAGAEDERPGGSTSVLPLARPPLEPGTVAGYVDPRYQHPAFASSPWAEAYFREFREQAYEGVPYVQARYRDRSGRYVNVEDNVRRTASSDEGPVVWFFGGSTMFGEGQRDDHTIPSEVAALAAGDGHPIQAVNFGVQADSDFQSVLRLEAALASDRPPPDVVVFYDGANEISQHASAPATDQPQFYEGAGGPSSPDRDGSLWDAWRRTSLIGRVLGGTDDAERASSPAPADVLVDQLIGVYERGQALARSLAADHDAAYVAFFQPTLLDAQLPWVADVRERLPEGTIDLARALDGPGEATYFDPVHTNEEGARLVAVAMYEHLAAPIAAADR